MKTSFTNYYTQIVIQNLNECPYANERFHCDVRPYPSVYFTISILGHDEGLRAFDFGEALYAYASTPCCPP